MHNGTVNLQIVFGLLTLIVEKKPSHILGQ